MGTIRTFINQVSMFLLPFIAFGFLTSFDMSPVAQVVMGISAVVSVFPLASKVIDYVS
ncbi:hypothetical protein GCM10009038_08640 [Salinicola rhizosphaerae]|uniref:Uncharacterized protein n=1 Tax=Salinicola rhizosphaerae TaxID=1443141 RepID=A0ABQ3DR96_9GAMM|nr:hypothetical protein GCM10009038_08640 [Salinicola rhizosphaerae]